MATVKASKLTRNMRKLTILLLLAAAVATAQRQMTIEDCMRYAIEHNSDVRLSAIDHANDRLGYRQSKASFFPTVGGSISAQYSFGRSIDPGTNTYDNVKTFNNSYGVSLSLTLFSGGQLVNDFRRARSQKLLSATAEESRRDETAIAVMDACVNYLYYRELVKIMTAKTAESRDALAKTLRMKELGMKSAVDLSQAEAQYAEDDYNLTNTISSFHTAHLTLKSTMNYPVADSISLAAPVPVLPSGSQPSAAEVMAFASGQNPLMRQAALGVDIARHSVRTAKGALFPTLTLNAGISDYYYRRYGSGDNMAYKNQMDVNFGQYVGVSMSIPIFSGLRRTTNLKKAKNRHLAAQIDYDRSLYELQTSVEQAVLDRDNYVKESGKLERKATADSVAYRFAKRKYEEGLMSLLDMRQMANAWFASQAELLRSRLLADVKRRLVDYYHTNTLF